MRFEQILNGYLDTVVRACRDIPCHTLMEIYKALLQVDDAGGRIYLCGNGGSAATAAHFHADLNNAFSAVRRTMPALCLSDNIPALTALSNDHAYDEVFLLQLQYLLREEDILFAISCSGNSTNILKAVEYARARGCKVISAVGFDGGKLKELSDLVYHAAVDNMQAAEDLHLMVCHLLATMVRTARGETND